MERIKKAIVGLLVLIALATIWTAVEVTKLVERGMEVELMEDVD